MLSVTWSHCAHGRDIVAKDWTVPLQTAGGEYIYFFKMQAFCYMQGSIQRMLDASLESKWYSPESYGLVLRQAKNSSPTDKGCHLNFK